MILLTPFHFTIELVPKFDPVRVSGKAAPPDTLLTGEIEVRTGIGLLMVAEVVVVARTTLAFISDAFTVFVPEEA